jgi:hypothetical protein
MSVALDANSTAPTTGTAVTDLYHVNQTVGPGANRLLVAQIGWTGGALPGTVSVWWDFGGTTQAMTRLVTVNWGAQLQADLWYLVNPTPGNKTLRVNWGTSTSNYATVNTVAFAGASGMDSGVSATGNGASASLAVTEGAGNSVIDCVSSDLAGYWGSWSHTGIFNAPSGVTGQGDNGGGASATLVENTGGASCYWVKVGGRIVAAASLWLVPEVSALLSTGVIGRSSFRT